MTLDTFQAKLKNADASIFSFITQWKNSKSQAKHFEKDITVN